MPDTSTSKNFEPNRAPEKIKYYNASQVFLLREVMSEYLWRLSLVCLISGALVLGAAYVDAEKSAVFAGLWLLVAVYEVWLLLKLSREGTLVRLYWITFAITLGLLVWWFLLCWFDIGPRVFCYLTLGFLLIGIGTLPWPWSWNVSVSVVFLTCLQLSFLLFGFSALAACSFLLLWLVVFRNAAVQHLNVVVRATFSFLAKYCDSSMALATTTLRLLAQHLAIIGSVDRALVLYGTESVELVSRGHYEPSKVDRVFVLGLVEKLNTLLKDDGVLSGSAFGEQFKGVFHDWFGLAPSRFFCVRLTAIIEDLEKRIYIMVPVRWSARFAGFWRTYRNILSVTSLAKVSLAAARNRFLSSDVLLSTQSSVSERELELDEIVHLVNNAVQDVSIQIDTIRGVIEKARTDKRSDSKEASAQLEKELEDLDVLNRHLAMSVSDTKLIKELLRVEKLGRADVVSVEAIVKDVEKYGKYWAQRKGEQFEVDANLAKGLTIKVASREFFEMVLRLCIRVASNGLDRGGAMVLKVRCAENLARFELFDTGKYIDEQIVAMIFSEVEVISVDKTVKYLRAARNLSRLSLGSFDIGRESGNYRNRICLAFPLADGNNSVGTAVALGGLVGWALFVDDNAQVTTFYARVAEALNLPYHTAASLVEAFEIVKTHGRPRFVITDVQLGVGSGLDLVRSLRQQFGQGLPVFVVSGNTEEGIRQEIQDLGATKYLTKPVGRSRLFAEIREILGA